MLTLTARTSSRTIDIGTLVVPVHPRVCGGSHGWRVFAGFGRVHPLVCGEAICPPVRHSPSAGPSRHGEHRPEHVFRRVRI